MIRFGAWSTLLAVFAAQMLALAIVLVASRTNALANRYLALLLLVLAGMMMPYVLGYAGYYDAFPWLTAAPFAIPLAVGPLFHAHVHALAESRPLAWFHFALPAAQFLYQAVLFTFPTASKWWWDEHVHVPFLGPPLALAVLVSMALYAWASWRVLGRYRSWLVERRRSKAPAARLRVAILCLGALVALRAAYELFEVLVRETDYFDMFGFYVLLGVIGIMLGLHGWRNAAAAAPAIEAASERDWQAQGAEWLSRLRENEWWRDPELDLPALARHLGTNSSHLSRALNAGNGGFAAALAAIRAEAVAAAIAAGTDDDLLALGLAAGFGSKASFNRGFQARFATSPSAYRREREAAQRLNHMH
jgi:AraC-like DNA-binding protein